MEIVEVRGSAQLSRENRVKRVALKTHLCHSSSGQSTRFLVTFWPKITKATQNAVISRPSRSTSQFSLVHRDYPFMPPTLYNGYRLYFKDDNCFVSDKKNHLPSLYRLSVCQITRGTEHAVNPILAFQYLAATW